MKRMLSIYTGIMLIILSACTPQKRLHRLLALHPELTISDTIHINDTTFLHEVRIDTFLKFHDLRDTVILEKEKLRVKLLEVKDTIFISAEREKDTVVIMQNVPIEKIVYGKGECSGLNLLKENRYLIAFILGFIVASILILVYRKT